MTILVCPGNVSLHEEKWSSDIQYIHTSQIQVMATMNWITCHTTLYNLRCSSFRHRWWTISPARYGLLRP